MPEIVEQFSSEVPGDAPELIQLLPAGRITANDGRVFVLRDPEAVIRNSGASGLDLPIDYEHQNDDPARRTNGPVPAAGWIKELIAKPDGIWARVEWTETARAHIRKREYRYISPALYLDNGSREVTRIKGAGLVHTPALSLLALAREDETAGYGEIARALDLPETAGMPEILAAISERKPNAPETAVPMEAVQELLADRNEKATRLREIEAERIVGDAVEQGYLTPAMRPWALTLCAADPEGFETFMKASEPAYGYLTRRAEFPSPQAETARAGDTVNAIASQLGLDPEALK